MKKFTSLLTVFVLLISVFLTGCGKSIDPDTSGKSDSSQVENTETVNTDYIQSSSTVGVITIKEGTDDEAKVNDFQTKLAKLFLDYSNAQLATNGLLLVDPQKMTLEEYVDFGKRVVLQWEIVEKDASDIANFESNQKDEISQNKKIMNVVKNIFGNVYAQDVNILTDDKNTFNDPPFKMINGDNTMPSQETMKSLSASLNANFSEGEPQNFNIPINQREQIDTIKSAVPKASLLQMVQSTFGVTAKQAKVLIEEHYQAEAQNYNNKEEFYRKAAVTSQAVSTMSKVTLFIGGAIVTAGGSAVLTTSAGGAIAAGMTANVGMVQGTLITVNGVGAILEIGENSATLGLASEDTAATFKDINKAISPVTNVLAITDLKDGLSNPGNLITIYERGKWGIEQGLDYVSMDVGGKKIIVNTKNPKQSYVTQDGIMAKIPEGLIGKTISSEEMEVIINQAKSVELLVGVYEGTTSTPYEFNGEYQTFDVWTQMSVSSDGSVKFKFDDKGNFSYNIQGFPFSADWTIKGSAEGNIQSDGNLTSNGKFNSTAKVNLPKEVPIPPEYQSKLQGGSAGTILIQGTLNGNTFQGDASFSANGITKQGSMTLERK